MAKRKSTGKRLRFEIFKRDGFKCAYCGRSPPEVLLQVDHIVPVAGGGDNDPMNLITACVDCNAGKSDKPLTSVAPPLAEQAEGAREQAEQVRAYADALLDARKAQDDTISVVSEAWYGPLNQRPGEWSYKFPAERVPSIKTFLSKLPMPEVLDAVDVAHAAVTRKPDLRATADSNGSLRDGSLFRYFCGVCWKKIRDREGQA